MIKEAMPQTDEAIPESKASLAKPAKDAKETLYSGFKPRESSFLCELSAFARTLLCFLIQLKNMTQKSRCWSVKHFIKTSFVLFLFLSSIQVAFSDDFFDKMRLLYEKKDFKTIKQECLKEIEKSPQSLDAYYFLAAIRLHEAKYDEAKPYMEKFQKYHTEMENRESRKTGQPVILIDARHTGLYFEIGKSRFMDARYADAIPWLLKAKSSFHKDPMLNFFLGISYKQTKDYDEAIKYLNRQLEYAPEEPSPYYNIACVYAEQGKTREAIASLKKAVEAHPEFRDQARSDKDFDKIRNTKEFMALIR